MIKGREIIVTDQSTEKKTPPKQKIKEADEDQNQPLRKKSESRSPAANEESIGVTRFIPKSLPRTQIKIESKRKIEILFLDVINKTPNEFPIERTLEKKLM